MKATITRYPNNEVRIALFPERLPRDLFKDPISDKSDLTPVNLPLDSSSQDSSLFSDCDGSNPPLDIKSKVDTVPRSPRMALSRYGRRQVLRAGSCFDSTESTKRLLLTGTLPGSSYKAFKALSEYSTYATKTLTNWLTRRSPGCAWMYTWEFQKRGALHLHLVVEVPLQGSEYIESHFKDEWNRILRAICRLSGVNLYAKTASYSHSNDKVQADVTICDREPSRYISKYISKASTHAKAFGRFPPKSWYQISRSLLQRLRDNTATYEVEGLSYRQSLSFIEDATHNLSRYDISGCRRFEGSILSWHGYFYHPDLHIEEWGYNFRMKGSSGLSVETMHNRAIAVMRNYPAARCYARMINANANVNANANANMAEAEMLTTIVTIMSSLTTIWHQMRSKTQAAMFLKSTLAWYEKEYESLPYTPKYRLEIDKICNEYLTKSPVRTTKG